MTPLEPLLAQLRQIADPAEAKAFEQTQIWPLVKERFWQENASAQNYAASFHTVGNSSQPVILAAGALKAARVVLLHTPQTLAQCAQIEAELVAIVERVEVDRTDPEPLYQAVKSLVSSLGNNSHLAFDATGGTNKMVAAMTAVVGMLGGLGLTAHLYFVEFAEFDAELRRPRPGSECLCRFPMP